MAPEIVVFERLAVIHVVPQRAVPLLGQCGAYAIGGALIGLCQVPPADPPAQTVLEYLFVTGVREPGRVSRRHGAAAENALDRFVVFGLDLAVALPGHLHVVVDRRGARALASSLGSGHQEEVSHQVAPGAASGIRLGHGTREVKVVGAQPESARETPLILARAGQGHIRVLLEDIALEAGQVRGEDVGRKEGQRRQDACGAPLICRRAWNRHPHALCVGLLEFAAAGDVPDGVRLDAFGTQDVRVHPQQAGRDRVVSARPKRVVVAQVDRIDGEARLARAGQGDLAQPDDLLHLLRILVHERLPRQPHVQVHDDRHVVGSGILRRSLDLVVNLRIRHLDRMADAGRQQPERRMLLVQVDEPLIALRLELFRRPEPASNRRPRLLDDVVFLVRQFHLNRAQRDLFLVCHAGCSHRQTAAGHDRRHEPGD